MLTLDGLAPACSPAALSPLVDSVCSLGACSAHIPRSVGTVCDDGDASTSSDMCDGAGICRGVDFVCPSAVEVRLPRGSNRAAAFWTPPTVTGYDDLSFVVSGTHLPGDRFRFGVNEVTYTASAPGPRGTVSVQCSFSVTVDGECDSECCGEPDGVRPRDVRKTVFFPDLEEHEAVFESRDSITCFDRRSVCDQPRAFLPRPFPMPPMHPPRFFQGLDGDVPPPRTTTTTTATTTTTSTTTATTTTTNTDATTRPVAGGCRPDVVVAVDASGSVTQSNFDLSIDFIKRVVDGIPIGSGNNDARVAGMFFHSSPKPQFDFDDARSTSSVLQAFDRFVYPTNRLFGTASGRALDYIVDDLLVPSAGHRVGAETSVLFMTDGRSQDSVTNAARRLQATGANIIVLGISDLVDVDQLNEIAGSDGTVILKEEFAELSSQAAQEVRDLLLCRDGATTSATTTTTSPTTTTTSAAASTARAVFSDVCAGKRATLSRESCRCSQSGVLRSCHTCQYEAGGVYGACTLCKLDRYLHEGNCVDSCPAGFEEVGTERFGRQCVPRRRRRSVEEPARASSPQQGMSWRPSPLLSVTGLVALVVCVVAAAGGRKVSAYILPLWQPSAMDTAN